MPKPTFFHGKMTHCEEIKLRMHMVLSIYRLIDLGDSIIYKNTV